MRNNLISLATVTAIALSAASAFAGDHGPSQYERDNGGVGFQQSASYGYQGNASSFQASTVRVVRLSEVGDGEQFAVVSANRGAEVQASLDAATAAELRAKGVQIQNIVGSAQPLSGRTILYIK